MSTCRMSTCKHGSPFENCLVPGLWRQSQRAESNSVCNWAEHQQLHTSSQQVKNCILLFNACGLLNTLLVLCLQISLLELTKGFSPQVAAREQGQYIAPDQQIRLTSPTMLKNFRDKISATASVVAAAAVTGAANSMQQLSFEARWTITAAAAAQARQFSITKVSGWPTVWLGDLNSFRVASVDILPTQQ